MNADKVRKFLKVAESFAAFSKDPSTKVGAVIVGPSGEVRSSGWNGAPRGCAADEDHRFLDRAEKLYWVAHAELNAITNAARVGTPLEGCSIIVTHPPCCACAISIVQAGIKAVYCPTPSDEFMSRWSEHIDRSNKLFSETNVGYLWI